MLNEDLHSFESRIQRARLSLEGATLADAFAHSGHDTPSKTKKRRELQWPVTEKSIMSWALTDVLETWGDLNVDRWAALLAERYEYDPARGYGNNMHRVLSDISAGRDWERAAADLCGGKGCAGNSAATRVTPLGAFYGDDLETLTEKATLSAAVTHAHPDASHGALAVALATAYLWQRKAFKKAFDRDEFFETLLARLPKGRISKLLRLAKELPKDVSAQRAVELLGSGARFQSRDTVPLALWIIARQPHSYEKAVREAIDLATDRESVAAIVGGAVAQSCGYGGFPAGWRQRREPFEQIQPDPLFCDYEESDEELLFASSED